MKALLALALAGTLLLAGCTSSSDSDPSGSTSGSASGSATATATGAGTSSGTSTGTAGSGTSTGTAGPATNHAPIITLFEANLTGKQATFTLNATDVDKDKLTFVLSFCDASANVTGALPASNVTHTFANPGNYTARFAVTDGKDATNRTLNITVLAGGATAPKQEDASFAGSVVCLPTLFFPGGISDGSHTLTVLPGQTKVTLTLAYDATTGVEDLDFTVTDPAGTVTESVEGGPEPPLEFDNPAAGDWTLTANSYSCLLSADYTITAVFG